MENCISTVKNNDESVFIPIESLVWLTLDEAKIIDKLMLDYNSRLTEKEYLLWVQLGNRIEEVHERLKDKKPQ